MSAFSTLTHPAGHLDPSLEGKVVLPGDGRFDSARRAWNLAIDLRPAAVVFPESATEVAATDSLRGRAWPAGRRPGHRA